MKKLMLLALVACGSAEKEPFDAGQFPPITWCQRGENEGKAQCSGSVALVCVRAVERSYACTGAMGCNESSGAVFCDFSNSSAGAPCPPGLESKALCKANVPDGGVFLQCVDGGFVATSCKRCLESAGQVQCLP